MLPTFAQTPDATQRAANPPRYFKPPKGLPRRVELKKSIRISYGGYTQAQKRGLKYEDAALTTLLDIWPARLLVQPSLRFYDSTNRLHIVYPDAVLMGLEGDFIIFEVKIRHSIDAYWQLEKLYKPVLEQMNGVSKVHTCEIVQSFDPSVRWPCEVQLLSEAEDFATWCEKPQGVASYRLMV